MKFLFIDYELYPKFTNLPNNLKNIKLLINDYNLFYSENEFQKEIYTLIKLHIKLPFGCSIDINNKKYIDENKIFFAKRNNYLNINKNKNYNNLIYNHS